MIDRRTFVAAASAIPVLPFAAKAQRNLRVIGWLHHGGGFGSSLNSFRVRLAELGWIEDRKITITVRAAQNDPERLPHLAAQLVSDDVDVIVTLTRAASSHPDPP